MSKELDCGNGIYKKSSELPHPQMDRTGSGIMDKKTLSTIIFDYNKAKEYNKIREIQKAVKFGISYNNIGTKKINLIGFTTIIFLIYFSIMHLFGLRR